MAEYVRDKVCRLLESGKLSDSDIALACGVTWMLVQSMKRQIKQEAGGKRPNVG